MKELLLYFALIMALLALALNAWVCLMRRKRLERTRNEQVVHDWDERRDLNPFREWLRVKLLAGGYGKHHAYHVTEDGVLLAVDVVDLYLACLAGLDEFWYVVESVGDARSNPFAVSLDEIDLGDGKGDFTYIDNCCGKSFVDCAASLGAPYAYDCARVTADEFKDAVVYAQAEAAERKHSRYRKAFHKR